MLDIHHEYRCECGHVGWSRHRGVVRLPLEGDAVLPSPHADPAAPSEA